MLIPVDSKLLNPLCHVFSADAGSKPLVFQAFYHALRFESFEIGWSKQADGIDKSAQFVYGKEGFAHRRLPGNSEFCAMSCYGIDYSLVDTSPDEVLHNYLGVLVRVLFPISIVEQSGQRP